MTSKIYLSPPHMGRAERELLLEAFDSNWVAPLGPHVDAFEKELAALTGVKAAVALSSGTAALHLALLLLDVGRDDEVFCSDFTFAASANVIMYCGATPVFIDCDRDTWNMSPALLHEELKRSASRGKLPKAVVVVDLYGNCADYDPILAACAEYGIPVVEDAAAAVGSTYKGRQAGSFGRFGAISFNGNKIITTSGGGVLLSDDEASIARARFLATQARDPAPHYEHTTIGYNYRLSNLLAAVGRGQLRLLPDRIERRRANFRFYRDALSVLPGIGFLEEPSTGRSNRWLTCITVDPREFGATHHDTRMALEQENIEARPVWKPMHQQPVYKHCRVANAGVGDSLFATGLCLPSGSSLSRTDLERICAIVTATARRRPVSVTV